MNKILSFVKLDFITVKPYFTIRTIIALIGIVFIMNFTTADSNWLIGFYMFFFSILFISYPFFAGEQNGIDSLYATLSINRSTVVLGRYIFGSCINAMVGIAIYLLSLISSIIFARQFNYTEGLIMFGAIFLICGIVQALQLPFYFKFGYAKAKFLVYLPFFIPILIVVLTNVFFKELNITELLVDLLGKIAGNPALTALIGAGIWLVAIGVSYKISLMFYKKRDF